MSLGDSADIWPHLVETVIFRYFWNTFVLMIGVAVCSTVIGVGSAWLISNYSFSFSKVLDWFLLLPAACPAYLVAYAYTDFLEYAGTVQGLFRATFGYSSPNDYYFPEIRSLGGAIFVMSFVLYPYIYVLARTAFRKAPLTLYQVARLYQKSTFFRIGLPLARPAILAGMALVCMEVVSDFGTVEYFSLETLTLGIFNVWIGMNSITAAAQLSVITFLFVIGLLFVEARSRAAQRFNDTSRGQSYISLEKIYGLKSLLAFSVCITPPMIGFFIPILVLATNSMTVISSEILMELKGPLLNSVFVSILCSFTVVLISCFVVATAQNSQSSVIKILANCSASGYAFPGTMLAVGVVVFAGIGDYLIINLQTYNKDLFSNIHFGGTIFLLLFAYVVRFQAIGFGAINSGIQKISPNLFAVSRSLGKTFSGTTSMITLPLLKTYILAAALLVFVDTMKELPMTLLLRPFNFETLATYTYQYAHDELMTRASVPALMIILTGLLPVVFLNHVLRDS